MPGAKITSKGQITLPKAVRDALDLAPGDRVSFRINEDGTVLLEPETVELLSLRGRLAPRRRGVTLEEMEAAIRRGGKG